MEEVQVVKCERRARRLPRSGKPVLTKQLGNPIVPGSPRVAFTIRDGDAVRAVGRNHSKVACERFRLLAGRATVVELNDKAESEERVIFETSTIVFLSSSAVSYKTVSSKGENNIPEHNAKGAVGVLGEDILSNIVAQDSHSIGTRIQKVHNYHSNGLY
jgi:hypothetical protein